MNNNSVFKVGKLKKYDSSIEVEELDNGCLYFFISTTPDDKYSLGFQSTITKKEFLEFEIGKIINLSNFVDINDVVMGEDGKFDLNCGYDLKINHYLSNSFLLILSVWNNDTYIYIENEFKI